MKKETGMEAQFSHSVPAQFGGQSAVQAPLTSEELKRAEPKQHEIGVRLVKTMKQNE